MKRAFAVVSVVACAGLLGVASFGGCAESVTPDPGTQGGGGASVASSAASSGTGGGQGGQGPCVHASDCPPTGEPCVGPICINGECTTEPANELGPCDDGDWCTDGDTCQQGACTGGTQKFCPSPDTCHIGACDPVAMACSGMPGNDGAQCDDGDPCTAAGSCSGGSCLAGTPIDCSFLDGPCSVGVCDPQVGCTVVPQAEGAPCDDNLFCTVGDHCTSGQCGGAPNPCVPPNDPCKIGVCDEFSASCVTTPGNDGVACDDGNLCTSGEKCQSGLCGGGAPANQGVACNDADGCSQGTTCSNGTCGNATSTITTCTNGDACCPPACALNMDDDCSLTRWSDGTMQWPDEACNPQFSFGGCNTNAQNHADAWATFVCQQNGYSSGIWTGNKIPGCAGPISMWCADMIPCVPIYENQCDVADQTQIEFTCFP